MRNQILLTVLCAALAAACGDDDAPSGLLDAGGLPGPGNMSTDAAAVTPSDAAASDAGTPALPALDCVVSPITYLDILNACTDAEKVTKNPVLPLLLVDGGLPPLP